MRGVSYSCFIGLPAVIKKYPHEETKSFKCFGSGARNEALLPSSLAELVPSLLEYSSLLEEETAILTYCAGRRRSVEEIGRIEAAESGEVLGRIHCIQSKAFGSLDSTYRFHSLSEAFIPRWRIAMQLLSSIDKVLAKEIDQWAQPRLHFLDRFGSPRLVHGDFGLSNLLWHESGRISAVLDWEHARFGDPREDWAKIRLARRFPEPNGFGNDCYVFDTIWATWQQSVGLLDLPSGPFMELYEAYYAASLGVFFAETGDDRIKWLASKVRNTQ